MAAACPRTDDPDAPARAELARLLLEGARRRLRERERDLAGDRTRPAVVRTAARRRRGARG